MGDYSLPTYHLDAGVIVVVDQAEWVEIGLLVERSEAGIVDASTAAFVCHMIGYDINHEIL